MLCHFLIQLHINTTHGAAHVSGRAHKDIHFLINGPLKMTTLYDSRKQSGCELSLTKPPVCVCLYLCVFVQSAWRLALSLQNRKQWGGAQPDLSSSPRSIALGFTTGFWFLSRKHILVFFFNRRQEYCSVKPDWCWVSLWGRGGIGIEARRRPNMASEDGLEDLAGDQPVDSPVQTEQSDTESAVGICPHSRP